jgi:hypothetical protein
MFIGGKNVAAEFGLHMPPAASLAFTLSLLGGHPFFSWWKMRADDERSGSIERRWQDCC